jgi:hypothetical protein
LAVKNCGTTVIQENALLVKSQHFSALISYNQAILEDYENGDGIYTNYVANSKLSKIKTGLNRSQYDY